ncbi:hypothetical protein ACVBEE_14560 [Acinetobacter sp. ANC 3781]
MSTFSDEKNAFYPDLLGTIDYINSARNHHGIKAEIYQHFILCGIEILANYSQSYEEFNIKLDFILNELIYEVVNNGFLKDEFISDLSELNLEYKLSTREREVVYKLVAQILYFDFDSTAFSSFHKFLVMGILKSDKFLFKNVDQTKTKEIEKDFVRAMLFCEFELLKNKYLKKEGGILKNLHKSITQVKIDNKREINKYLKNLSEILSNNSLLLKSTPDCPGLMGSWIFYEAHAKNGTLTLYRQKFEDNKFVFDQEEDIEDVCAEIASQKMSIYGFKIKARAIYNHSLRFDSFYILIKLIFEEMSKEKYSLFLPGFEHSLRSGFGIPESFSEALTISNNKLKKLNKRVP